MRRTKVPGEIVRVVAASSAEPASRENMRQVPSVIKETHEWHVRPKQIARVFYDVVKQ